jgi:hypothetical protein
VLRVGFMATDDLGDREASGIRGAGFKPRARGGYGARKSGERRSGERHADRGRRNARVGRNRRASSGFGASTAGDADGAGTGVAAPTRMG